MKFQVKTTKRLGLEVYQVYVCGVFATEFLSLTLANTYVMQQQNRLLRKAG